MQPTRLQLSLIRDRIRAAKSREGSLYNLKYKDIDENDIMTAEAFQKLPFTEKSELRDAYPLGIQAVDDDQIVRIHSSSGTTGTPIIIPYTQQDVDDWAFMFKRCYEMAGITKQDRIHITPGYGLWTAGIGFQLGAELLGAMAIPMGPGNTDKQIKMMTDLGSTVLCATSSYALLLAEEIEKRGVRDKIKLTKGVIGSERWGDKMRERIARELGVELYDIYGLTEIYGPGIGVSCGADTPMHYFDDFIYLEIIDPKTGEVLPDGEIGEIVITTLKKQGAPLIRYRTHDLSRIVPEECKCGYRFPRIDRIIGRSDDMVKVKGVNIYPGQIEDVLRDIEGVSSEYQVMIDHLMGKDEMTLFFETQPGYAFKTVEASVGAAFKTKIGLTIKPKAVAIGELPRSEKKSTRIYDNRY
ncbi:MAG: phenylacetate--CoA ligase [Clostridia bacterium]|nr:phenylacetate--CoA ligase [Clostridia bacterium]